MVKKIKVNGFVRKSMPALSKDVCYFVAWKDGMYYLISVDMSMEAYDICLLDAVFEKDGKQRDYPLYFNDEGFLEFQCKSDHYTIDPDPFDVDNRVKKTSLKKGRYRLNIKDTSYESYHYQDDEEHVATTYFKEATVLNGNDEEVLKIRFLEHGFEDVSIYGANDENIVFRCNTKSTNFYLNCNIRNKVINIYYPGKKTVMESYYIMTEGWTKGTIYENCDNICFSLEKNSIVYWGLDNKLKYQSLNDVNYVLEQGKAPDKYSNILCVTNAMEVYKSGWDDGSYSYKVRVRKADKWKEGTFKVSETSDVYKYLNRSMYSLRKNLTWIWVSNYLFVNTCIEFDEYKNESQIQMGIDIGYEYIGIDELCKKGIEVPRIC